MDITENKLQQIIIEELKETLGMDQEYTGSETDVDAENDLAGALMALQNAGYSHEEVIDMVDDAYGVTGASKKRYDEAMTLEDCGCPSCPEHGSGAKIRVKVK